MALDLPSNNLFKTVSKDHTILRDGSTMLPSTSSSLHKTVIIPHKFSNLFSAKGNNKLTQKQIWNVKHPDNPIDEEIVNLKDIESLKTRSEYIRVEVSKKRATVEDFNKRVEIGSWRLLTLITDNTSFSEAVIFMSDPIGNVFDLDMTFESGRNYLMFAVAKSERIIVEKLIEMKPTLLNKKDDFGRTSVHYAVLLKKSKILSLIVDSGADIFVKDINGQTPLHYAAQKSDRETYLFLKFRGSDGLLPDNFGMKPVDYITFEDDYHDILQMEIGSAKKKKKKKAKKNNTEINYKASLSPNRDSTTYSTSYYNPTRTFFNRKRQYFQRLGMLVPGKKFDFESCYSNNYDAAMKEQYEDSKPADSCPKLLDVAYSNTNRNNSMPLLLSNSLERINLVKNNLSCNEQTIKSTRLSMKDINVMGVLGKGGFGKIYCVSVKGSNELYAMKSYNKKQFFSSSIIRFLFIEKKVMVNFDHPFLIKLNYAFQNRDELFILMDYCEKKDLTSQVLKLDELQVKIMTCELILAIKALHDQNIIHRDIKPDNVFIAADGHIKLGDFGLAKEGVTKGSTHHTFCGSIAYLPPEIVRKVGHNKTIDWYLLGELLYEMVVGIPPYYGESKEALMNNILHKELDFDSAQVSDSLKDLIERLLDRNIHSRLGSKYDATEVMEHHYFVGIDWDKVYKKKFNLFVPEELVSYKLKKLNSLEFEDKVSNTDCDMALPYWSFTR